MKLITTLSRAAGLGLCVVALSGTALADPGNGNGNGPEATPPGQEKKAETPAATAPAQAPAPQSAQGQENKAENAQKQAEKKAAPKPAAKSTAPGQAKKAEKQAEHKPAKAASESKGQSVNAHHHVIICHRTGSLSNPYVVLNIPWTAWTHGHATHPAKNDNADKILKDPASRPGSKDGFTKADCGAAPTPPAANVTPTSEGGPAGITPAIGAVGVLPAQATAAAPVGGVAGAVAPAPAKNDSGGVLGAIASAPEAIVDTATSATLPFTGFPLWIVMLIGIAVLASGLMLRRRTTA